MGHLKNDQACDSGEPQESRKTHISRPAVRESVFRFHHLPQLDGFRGAAVILVLVGHVIEFSPSSAAWAPAGSEMASLGVFLFFVLSGFLITGILDVEKLDTGKIHLPNFYIRRVLRLGPALLLFLFVVVVLMACRAITDVPRYEIIASLFYVRNFFGRSTSLAHLWSLSLEEQFYLCWPLLFSLVPIKKAFLWSLYVTISVAIWRGLAIQFNLFDYAAGIYYMRPYFRFDSILIGACLTIALTSQPKFFSRSSVVARRVPASALWLCLILWTAFGEAISRPLYLTIQMLLIASLILQLVVAEEKLSSRLFEHAYLRYIGKISYSLYLWQQIFLVTKSPDWGMLRRFPMNMLLSFVLAILSYHFIERPVLRLKERFQFAED